MLIKVIDTNKKYLQVLRRNQFNQSDLKRFTITPKNKCQTISICKVKDINNTNAILKL